jgi:DNA gyrase/topoisomerase IV subunit B
MTLKSEDIKILSDRDHCLKRPEIWIGSTRIEKREFWFIENGQLNKEELDYIPGQYKLFCEILDNAIDEHIRGHGDKIKVHYDMTTGFITIKDNARGIPIDVHKEAKVHTPQVVFAQLRSGSNFNDQDGRTTVGMNGVGASLCTIFSEKLIIEIHRDNKVYKQVFSDNMDKIGKPSITDGKSKSTGTAVSFKLDDKIFKIPLSPKLIRKRCQELSYAFPKLEIHFILIEDLGQEAKEIYKGNDFESLAKMVSDEYRIVDEKKFKMAICFNTKTENFEHISNVNGADTWRGGTHVDYFRELFCSDIQEKIRKENKIEVSPSDVAKNLFIILFTTWNAPTFEGQTKEKLVNDKKEISTFYDEFFSSRKVTSITSDLPKIKQQTVDDVTAKNDKKLLSELKKTQKALDRKRIPKLIECSSRQRQECSIYITEGDSAISNLATVRNAKTMAGLPLRGKILNVHEISPKDALENKELQAIMASIGLKFGEDCFNRNNKGIVTSSNLSYGRIIIATDQDMDGYCIRSLMVNFFYKFWPELFTEGIIHILECPLYEVIEKKSSDIHYFYDKVEYEDFMKNKKSASYEVSYFKGLGSCGKEAWNYMINEKPNLIKLTLNDVQAAKNILQMAFGDDPDARKKWIAN